MDREATSLRQPVVTAREIAEELGIAISTVGRALADDRRISAETKARVRAAADKLGYVGNNPARIMRGGSSRLVGLLIPDVGNDFYGTVAQTLSTSMDRQSYGLMLSLTEDDPERELRQVRELIGARAAGIIMVPTAKPKRETMALLARIPHVQFLRRLAKLGGIWFGIDDNAALQAATNHLLANGHERIAYIGGNIELSTGAARVGGYRTALSAAKVATAGELERLGPPTAEFGLAAVKNLLELPLPPTAIVTGSVHITLGVIQFLEKAGVATPGRLSLIGFGGADWFNWWRGGLTSIQPPVRALSNNCALWFLDYLRAGGDAAEHASTSASTLVIRSSVRPLR